MKRREMLRLALSKAARILPVALAAAGNPVKLMQTGAGLIPPQGVASFPAGAPKKAQSAKNLTTEEA